MIAHTIDSSSSILLFGVNGRGAFGHVFVRGSVEVDGFEELHAYAQSGGTDTACLYDSDKNDKFKAETAEHYANDTFVGQKDLSWLTTPSGRIHDVKMHNFARVIAYAYQGGNDMATLKDSELKDEFHGRSHKSEIFDDVTNGTVYEITARHFDSVYADGSEGGGRDAVKLWETPYDNYVEAEEDWARLWNEGTTRRMLYEVMAFEFVKVRASTGGSDKSDVEDPLAFELLFEGGWDTD